MSNQSTTTVQAGFLAAALPTVPDSWSLIPVSQKRAYIDAWQKTGLSRESIKQAIIEGKADGFGILTGELSGGVIAIDCDGHEPHARFKETLGSDIPKTVAFASGKDGRAQYLFSVPQEHWAIITTKKEGDPKNGGQLEWRWGGCYSVLPPSAHPETDGYSWVNSPEECPIAPLPEKALEHLLNLCKPKGKPSPTKPAAKKTGDVPPIPLDRCLSNAHRQALTNGVSEGGRNAKAIAIARDLLGCEAWLNESDEPFSGDAQSLYIEFCNRCSPPIDDRERDRTWVSAQKYQPEPSINDPEAFQNCIDGWKREHGLTDGEDDHQDLKTAVDEKLATLASDYPLHKLFPRAIADPLAQYCDRTAVPHGLIAMALITCLATLLHPKSHLKCFGGTDRIAKPIFWFGVYGLSGNGKSHSYAPVLKYLRMFAGEALEEYTAKLKEWEALQKKAKRAKPDELDEVFLEKLDEPKPDRKRYVIDSTTIEALLTRSAKQPDRGLLMYADELVGWCHRMDPAKGEVEMWLSLKQGVPVDGERQTREFQYVEAPSISVMGGIQPDVMAKLVQKHEDIQNGFLPRLTLVRFEEQPAPPLSDLEPPDFSPIQKVFTSVRDSSTAIETTLDPKCFTTADQWQRETSGLRIHDSRKSFKALYPKFNELGYQIAFMLHVINRTSDPSQPEKIPLATFETALEFTRWLLGQSVSIYEELLENNLQETFITSFVKSSEHKGWMKARDIQKPHWRKFKTVDDARQFMSTLMGLGLAIGNGEEPGGRKFQIRICPANSQKLVDKWTQQSQSDAQTGLIPNTSPVDAVDKKLQDDDITTVSGLDHSVDKNGKFSAADGDHHQKTESLSTCPPTSTGVFDSGNPKQIKDLDSFVHLSTETREIDGQPVEMKW
jgi:Protein of unknown function (DUF3987)/Bifunctional DNA primase/polymerase, N-terminal